jgi:hypothetical protein
MSLPAVGQAQMIAEQLDRALERWVPTSIAVIGCAGGNGLETIAGKTVERVVAVDVNPDYIERVRTRYAQWLQGLALVCADVQSYKSLGSLASAMTLVAPETLRHAAADVGFAAADSAIIELSSGKRFCVQHFRV